nr:efflux RND transporter permease subunit [Coxiella endosymbiont of Ornithodoros amblus]
MYNPDRSDVSVDIIIFNPRRDKRKAISLHFNYINKKAKTDIGDKQAFENLVIKEVNGTLIRIRDIDRVEFGTQDYNSSVYMNGKIAIFCCR